MLLICAASSGHNLTLARRLSLRATALSIPTELLDLTTVDLPVYTPARDTAGAPASLMGVAEQFHRAHGFFVCAPEYNGSIPPTLNNTIAWLSTQTADFRALFNAKPMALATHSGGGGQKVLLAMRQQFAHLGCNVVGRELLTNPQKPLRDASADAILEQLQYMMSSTSS